MHVAYWSPGGISAAVARHVSFPQLLVISYLAVFLKACNNYKYKTVKKILQNVLTRMLIRI